MFLNAVSFLSGMLILFFLQHVEQAIIVLPISFSCFLFIFFLFRSQCRLLWAVGGVFWACSSVIYWEYTSNRKVLTPKVAVIKGSICSIPYQQSDMTKFDFCVERIDGHPVSILGSNKLKLTWGRYAVKTTIKPKSGQFWKMSVKLKPVHGRFNPGGFDYERWMLAKAYIGTASVKKYAELLPASSDFYGFASFRQKIYTYIYSILQDDAMRPMILAMLLGEKKGISQEQWQVFQGAGTSHLLAISGLHIGIAALWSYWVICFAWKRSKHLCLFLPAQRMGELGSLVGALSLLIISGADFPAQRAFIMLLLFLIARWSGRHYRLSSVLGFAMVVILLLQPFALLSASFWLSFIAVSVISWVVSQQVFQPSKLKGWLQVNGYLYLVLLPVSLLFFGQLSWVSIVANLVLVPLFSFLVTPLLYFAALISSLFQTAGSLLFEIVSLLMEGCYFFQRYLAQLNAAIPTVNLDHLSFGLFFLAVVIVMINRTMMPRICLLPLVMLVVFILPEYLNIRKAFEMWVFDVGQGLSIYIETAEGNLLYDTAWGNSRYAVASSTIIPFLEQRNITSIDKVIISHADADHAGGLNVISEQVKIHSLVSGEPMPRKIASDNPFVNCHEALPWVWGEVEFRYLRHLALGSQQGIRGNNASCVLSIAVGEVKLLLTGDIEKTVEKNLLSAGLVKYDIVIAPHHGSNTSSTPAFVMATQPKHVIFSTGYDNQWKFPKAQVVKRYTDVGSVVWVTHRNGAIQLILNNDNNMLISSHRNENRHFWHK